MDMQRTGSVPGCRTDELDDSDIEEDAEGLYSFAHAEADAFPRAWDDARHDFEDDDLCDAAAADPCTWSH